MVTTMAAVSFTSAEEPKASFGGSFPGGKDILTEPVTQR